VEGGGGPEFCIKSCGEVLSELQDELGSPIGDYGVLVAVKTVHMVDEGVDQLLGSQSCNWDKMSHFRQSTDNNE
jgi:hypothetical protein